MTADAPTPAPSDKPLRLGVLVSGAGTSLQNLIDRIADGRLPKTGIGVVVSSRRDVRAVDRARKANLRVEIIRVKDWPDVAAFSEAVAAALDRYGAEWAVQAGWLCYWRPPERWRGRVINVHPALLPAFGGKGYYGLAVHQAVLATGATQSGATIHLVDDEYDHGRILFQRACPVLAGDTPESLAERVQAVERELLPEAIAALRAGPPAR